MHVHATDAAADWLLTIGAERIDVADQAGDADCSVHATASELYLLLWNRRGVEGLDVRGDASVIDLWKRSVRIHWR